MDKQLIIQEIVKKLENPNLTNDARKALRRKKEILLNEKDVKK
jgi:hypothetical protein